MEPQRIGNFTINKQQIRVMNSIIIKEFYESIKDNLSGKRLKYLGLPSEEMMDIFFWKEYLSHISAVERGNEDKEFITQHNLLLKSFLLEVSEITTLYRGDMDNILNDGQDKNSQKLQYPYHIINLDYSGGFIYKEESDRSKRIDSLKKMFEQQARLRQDFILIITCNMDNDLDSEYKSFITKLLVQNNVNKDMIEKHYKDPIRAIKLKTFVLNTIQDIAKEYFECEFFKPIFYKGNGGFDMINFSFKFKYIDSLVSEKKVKYSKEDIINHPCFFCIDGKISDVNFELPTLK